MNKDLDAICQNVSAKLKANVRWVRNYDSVTFYPYTYFFFGRIKLLAIKDEYIRVMTQEYSSNTISLIIENAIIKAYNKSHNDTDSLLSFFKIPIK